MDFFVTSTIVLGIWAALGPLVGIRYGQELANKWQRQHWIKDNVKQECRELLAVITNAFSVILKFPDTSRTIEQIRERDRVEQDTLELFYTMLFISEELSKLKTRDRWVSAIRQYHRDQDGDAFAASFGKIAAEIRDIAKAHIG